ncbi:hypothetical protein OCF84_21445 (plasmid) [Shewanella xiamenensis]|uniref:Phage protein n=1 Tax=Shewanella xiamenensis TaxID=332186 RepID=A0ABT6UDL6_9GAMM|nr:hypothetical protein [Shewanella xiamenensis]MDI5832558.1 hypothetical protein [Shewanella xiamenensis]WHF57824.1 hypothetical protein OCF84_21445 [Shewanella xiamenensis]
MKTYYQFPDTVITTMDGVSWSSGCWAYKPPMGISIEKTNLKGKTLDELYGKMQKHGISIDERCSVDVFVNECPSKLIISKNSIKARIDIVNEQGIASQPQFRFEFNVDNIASFTNAMVNALKLRELEQMNRRFLQLIKMN